MNKYEVNMKRFLTNYTSIKVNKHTRYKKNLRASSGVENIREDRGDMIAKKQTGEMWFIMYKIESH